MSQPPGPAISANPVVGSVVTETAHGGWSGSPTDYAYQWQLCDGAGNNCGPITGATSSSYSPTQVQVGATLRLQETASNAYGTASGGETSAASAAIQGTIGAPPPPPPPLPPPPLPPTASPPQPSSNFSSVGSPSVDPRTGAITFTEKVNDPGAFNAQLTFQNGKFGAFTAKKTKCKPAQLKLKGKCRPKTVRFGSTRTTASSAGIVKFTVAPSASASNALKTALKKKRGITVTATLIYQSARGGTPVSRTQTIQDKLKKRNKK
ncbi:MAG: hypothetical protein NVS3B25_31610 [Hymenobacter sp.]